MFLLIPVGVQYNARRYPMVTFTLMGINVLLYLISLVFFFSNLDGDVEQREWMVMHLGMIPEESVWWTYLTSMFVHAGFFHILGNMIYLFLFGSCLEDTIGRWQFTIFYLLSGVAATFAYKIITPAHEAGLPLVGASGAISACIGGFLLILAKTKINFRYLIWFWFRIWSGDFWLPAWLVISFWFLSDLFWAVLSHNVPDANDGTAFAAHVAGTVCGAGVIGLWRMLPEKMKFKFQEEDEIPAQIVGKFASQTAAETADIYLYHGGNQLGPFTASQVTQMLALGSIDGNASYWREGMADWQNVLDLQR